MQSLLALWLFERFDLSLSAASLFFFWTGVLSAFSYPVAAWLSKRIGLINTMVYHAHSVERVSDPRGVLAEPLSSTLGATAAALRAVADGRADATSYVMAVVTPAERTAAASVTAVPRSLASSISPAMAGVLLTTTFSGLPLVVCGILKIVYDVALLYSFRHIKPPEERRQG